MKEEEDMQAQWRVLEEVGTFGTLGPRARHTLYPCQSMGSPELTEGCGRGHGSPALGVWELPGRGSMG